MSTSTDRPEPDGGIPPYSERDQQAARRAIELWRDRPIRSRIGSSETDDLAREIAGAVATARHEGFVAGWNEAIEQ